MAGYGKRNLTGNLPAGGAGKRADSIMSFIQSAKFKGHNPFG